MGDLADTFIEGRKQPASVFFETACGYSRGGTVTYTKDGIVAATIYIAPPAGP